MESPSPLAAQPCAEGELASASGNDMIGSDMVQEQDESGLMPVPPIEQQQQQQQQQRQQQLHMAVGHASQVGPSAALRPEGQIRVGSRYQAEVPAHAPVPVSDTRTGALFDNVGEKLWDPVASGEHASQKICGPLVDRYLIGCDELHERMLGLSMTPTQRLHVLNLLKIASFDIHKAIRSVSDMLLVLQEEARCATADVRNSRKRSLDRALSETSQPHTRPWTEDDILAFDYAFLVHGKKFRLYRAKLLPHRSVQELIVYYFCYFKQRRPRSTRLACGLLQDDLRDEPADCSKGDARWVNFGYPLEEILSEEGDDMVDSRPWTEVNPSAALDQLSLLALYNQDGFAPERGMSLVVRELREYRAIRILQKWTEREPNHIVSSPAASDTDIPLR